MRQARRPKGEATRERILAAALSKFAEKGFAQATMREIAAEAGCSLGLAYRYFATKDAMVLELYEQLVEGFAADAAALPVGPLAQRWSSAMRLHLGHLQAHRPALMGLISAGLAPGRETQVLGAATTAVRRRMLAIFTEIVAGAKDAPRPEVAKALGSLFYALHLVQMLFWLQDPTPGQRVTHALIDFGEEMLGRFRLVLRLSWTVGALTRMAGILGPVLDGSALPEAEPSSS